MKKNVRSYPNPLFGINSLFEPLNRISGNRSYEKMDDERTFPFIRNSQNDPVHSLRNRFNLLFLSCPVQADGLGELFLLNSLE